MQRSWIDSPPWLVRIYHHAGSVAGAGFYTGDGVIVTCAHVVSQILENQGNALSSEFIDVAFPFVSGAAKTIKAQFPSTSLKSPESPGEEDVAALLLEDVPDGAVPAPLRRPPTLTGHSVSFYGFPQGPNGIIATGVVRGRRGLRGHLVQIEDVKAEGEAIRPGFSGSPVWDKDIQAVVGMVVSRYQLIDSSIENGDAIRAKIGSMIPVQEITHTLPWLGSWVRWRLDCDDEFESHWLPHARGVPVGEADLGKEGWFFTGRQRLLGDLSDWLAAPIGHNRAIHVIAGRPGAGKSAAMARLLVLADQVIGPTVPLTDAERASRPPLRSIDIAVHARDKTLAQVVNALAAAAEVEAATPEQLLGRLANRDAPFTIAVDALEEAAANDIGKIADLLQLLAAARSRAGIRIIASVRTGSRDPVTGRGLDAILGRVVRLDLDEDYFEFEDIAAYARRRLVSAIAGANPYQQAPKLAQQVASAIASKADKLFLVAQLVCEALVFETAIDITKPTWQDELPGSIGDAMDRYVRIYSDRFGLQKAQALSDFFSAVAYAEGNGFPASTIWATVASVLSPRKTMYSHADLYEVISGAASFLIEKQADSSIYHTVQASENRYRLFHRELVAHFRRDRQTTIDQLAIVQALTETVPARADGQPDWFKAEAYVKSHLAAHAAAAGILEDLIEDPMFLIAADSEQLLLQFTTTGASQVSSIRATYLGAVHDMKGQSKDTAASYLELHARQNGLNQLANRIDAVFPNRPWFVRWADCVRPSVSYHVIAKYDVGGAAGIWDIEGRPIVIICEVDTAEPHSTQILSLDAESGHYVYPSIYVETWVMTLDVVVFDGLPLVVVGGQGLVRALDLRTGTTFAEWITGRGDYVDNITVFMDDSQAIVIAGDRTGVIESWDLPSKQRVGTKINIHEGNGVRSLAATRLNDEVVIIAGGGTRIQCWELASGMLKGTISNAHTTVVEALVVMSIGNKRVLVSCGFFDDDKVRVWNLEDFKLLWAIEDIPYAYALAAVDLTSEPILVTGSRSGDVQVWDLSTRQLRGRINEFGVLDSLAVARVKDRYLLMTSGIPRGNVRILDLASLLKEEPTAKKLLTSQPRNADLAIAKVQAGWVLIARSHAGKLAAYDLVSGEPQQFLIDFGHVIALAVASMEGELILLSAEEDGSVKFCKPFRSRESETIMQAGGAPIHQLSLAVADNSLIAIGTRNQQVLLFDLTERTVIELDVRARWPTRRGIAAVPYDNTAYGIFVREDLANPHESGIEIWDLIRYTRLSTVTAARFGAWSVSGAIVGGHPLAVVGTSGSLVYKVNILDGVIEGRPLRSPDIGISTVSIADNDGTPIVAWSGNGSRINIARADGNQFSIDVQHTVTSVLFITPSMLAIGGDRGVVVIELP